jgi:hypothetical protein
MFLETKEMRGDQLAQERAILLASKANPNGLTVTEIGISPGSATNVWVMRKLSFNLVEDLTAIIRLANHALKIFEKIDPELLKLGQNNSSWALFFLLFLN